MTLNRQPYYLLIVSGVFLALVTSGLSLFYLDWRGGHITFNTYAMNINWIAYKVEHALAGFGNYLFPDKRRGLPPVRLYVPRRSHEALMSSLPTSVKNWQSAYRLYPDNRLRKVKVRFRGDNPFNWLYDKKAWRVKTKKKRLIDGVRVFNYAIPQSNSLIAQVLAMRLAREIGVLSPRTRLVEMFVNEGPHGILVEMEHLDESFLRNNGLMPINIYKGEQAKSDRTPWVDPDLMNNPGLWTKIAVNNHLPAESHADLAYALGLLREAETSETSFALLRQVAPYDIWTRFAAFQALTQNVHNGPTVNMRLAFDTWSGRLLPIAIDNYLEATRKERFIDAASHSLLRLYHRRSDFVLAKYRLLFKLLTEDRVLERVTAWIDDLDEEMDVSVARDANLLQNVYGMGYSGAITTVEGGRGYRKALRDAVETLQGWLLDRLGAPPKAEWRGDGRSLRLTIDGWAPLGAVTLWLSPNASVPSRVYLDADRDGRIGAADVVLPIRNTPDGTVIDAVWLASRNMLPYTRSGWDLPIMDGAHLDGRVRKTRFDILADVPLSIVAVEGANALTGERVSLPRGASDGAVPGRWNRPVLPMPTSEFREWTGTVSIRGDRVIDYPVRILSGTTIKMAPGATIVFRGKLEVLGTPGAPVKVVRADAGRPWGAVALQGHGTAGSRISHLEMEGGSGDWIRQVRYTAMMSVHDTEDVEFRNLVLRKNQDVDDMMHVVYSRNVRLFDIDFEDAQSDALDIDMSDVVIEGGRIARSGNDAIDLMTSTARISGVLLERSGDKGVSVGEASTALIVNSRIRANGIGVESKDGSKVQLVHAELLHNLIQINAYRKNWRYGTGGALDIRKSIITGPNTKIVAKKGSSVVISDSTVKPMLEASKRVQLFVDVDESGGRVAHSADYGSGMLVDMDGAISPELRSLRGAKL